MPIIGTSPEAIDRAEDRERFQQMVQRLNPVSYTHLDVYKRQ